MNVFGLCHFVIILSVKYKLDICLLFGKIMLKETVFSIHQIKRKKYNLVIFHVQMKTNHIYIKENNKNAIVHYNKPLNLSSNLI